MLDNLVACALTTRSGEKHGGSECLGCEKVSR